MEKKNNRWLECHPTLFVSQIPAHLMLRIERCWATPTSDPYSNIQYAFIRDRLVRTKV